jgi:dUTP pyrophosphatase
MKIQIKKVRDVKTPSRGTPESAGLDFYIPKDYIDSEMMLAPGQSLFIPSGIKVRIPNGFALIAFEKSGVAVKQGLTVGAKVVDSDYDGEVHLHLVNTTDKNVFIQPEQKITQFVLLPVVLADVEEVLEFEERASLRGSGGFGSTGL